MKTILKLTVIVFFILQIAACGDPTIDSSSDKAMKDSIKLIMAELSSDEQTRFKKTIVGIYMLGGIAKISKEDMNEKMHGKTADEVFAMADEIRQKMKNN